MIPLVVIVGPTASGKTALSIEIAKRLGGEIVSADSMQVYKQMNIGTAKPDEEEKQGIAHHLIDVVDIGDDFSVNSFAKMAHAKIRDIYIKGKLPILVGGTGLYTDVVVYNTKLSEDSFDVSVRKRLEGVLLNEGREKLYDMLCHVDAPAAEKLHVNDVKRVMRALEIYYNTGKTKTYLDSISNAAPKIYNSITFGISYERERLYERINMRVDKMMENGLLQEVEALSKNPGFLSSTAGQGIGYKEIIYYLNGTATYDEAVRILKRDTRRLAKRQLTWFRKNKDIIWLDGEREFGEMVNECIGYIEKTLK